MPESAVDQLVAAVAAADGEARRRHVTAPFAFATSIVRDAPNREENLEKVRSRTGVELGMLHGETEAELTFLAARRWMGWRAGPLLMLDIGGGSVEVAFGRNGLADFAASLPLGAGRLTRDALGKRDPPSGEKLKAVRRRVRQDLRDVAARVRWEAPRAAVATSRTFQQLGRLCGAAPGRKGPFVERHLTYRDLGVAVRRLAALPAHERAALPGISRARSVQCLAGAVVARTAMKVLDVESVLICPWGLREGIMLRAIEEGGSQWWAALGRQPGGTGLPAPPIPLRRPATDSGRRPALTPDAR